MHDSNDSGALSEMLPAAEIRGMSIVLVGDFNPAIFQPAWFGAQGLIRPTEANRADVEIVHSEVTKFKLEWCVLQVTRDRFIVETSQDAFFETSRDLVLATFELLGHTPVRAMGINTQVHYRMSSTDKWRKLSRALASEVKWQGLLEQAQLENVTMQGARPDHRHGYVQVQVQPSRRVTCGVFVNINDHYVTTEPQLAATTGTRLAMEILRQHWQASNERSLDILKKLVTGGEI